jgi:hypothetical protein
MSPIHQCCAKAARLNPQIPIERVQKGPGWALGAIAGCHFACACGKRNFLEDSDHSRMSDFVSELDVILGPCLPMQTLFAQGLMGTRSLSSLATRTPCAHQAPQASLRSALAGGLKPSPPPPPPPNSLSSSSQANATTSCTLSAQFSSIVLLSAHVKSCVSRSVLP